MNDDEFHKEYLRTKVIKEYAIAISALEVLYYKADASDLGLAKTKTREIAGRSFKHRWIVHAIQEHGLRGEGVFLSYFMDNMDVSRSSVLSVLKSLITSNLVYTAKCKNEHGRMVTCYNASEEMLDSFLDFAVYVFRSAKETKITEKFNNCAVIDEIIGLEAPKN